MADSQDGSSTKPQKLRWGDEHIEKLTDFYEARREIAEMLENRLFPKLRIAIEIWPSE